MADRDHRDQIRDLVSAGKLDEALSIVRETASKGSKLDVGILLPLARALLAKGRDQDSLDILERASTSAVFGGELEKIATEIGLPQRRPSTGFNEPARGSGSFARLENTGDLDATVEEITTPTERVKLGRRTVVEVKTQEELPRRGFATPTDREELQTSLSRGDVAFLAKSFVTPTTRTEIEPRTTIARGGGKSLSVAELATPTTRVEIEPRTTVDLAPAAVRTDEGQDTDQVQIPPGQSEDEQDTDQVSLPKLRQEEELETRATIPAPPAPSELENARGELSVSTAEVSGEQAIDTSDSTRKLDLTDIEVIQQGVRRQRDTLESVLSEAQLIKAERLEVTNKLRISELEVIGFFEVGKKEAPSSSLPYFREDPSKEIDFAAIPDADEVEDPPAEETGSAEPEHVGPARPRPSDTTDKLIPPPPRQAARAPRRNNRRLILTLVTLACLGLVGAGAYYFWRQHEEISELARVQEALADDTYESHRRVMDSLAGMSRRSGDGTACAFFAAEAALMWGRFGLGSEHGEAAARTLQSCQIGRDSEEGVFAQILLAHYGGDTEEGLRLGEGGLVRFSSSAKIHTALAWIRESRGEIQTAHRNLRSAHRLDPTYLPAALSLARLHRRAGRRGEARLLIEDIRRRSPRHVEARAEELMLTLDSFEGETLSQAEIEELRTMSSSLENAAEEQPPAIAALVFLARGRFALVEGNVEHAGVLLGRAWRQGTKTPEAALHVARGLRLAGDLTGSLEVSKRQPTEAPAMAVERVRALLAAGRPEAALVELNHAEQPQSGERNGGGTNTSQEEILLLHLKARALQQRSDPLAGKALLERQLRSHPNSGTRFQLATLMRSRGNWLLATQLLEEVTAPPWSPCAEAAGMELEGRYREALQVLGSRGERRALCTLRERALVSSHVGDPISEISSLRTLMRVDSHFDDRLALARAVWRERGANAALTELRAVLSSPPTGQSPLMELIDLLATIRAEEDLVRLLRGAEAAGATAPVLQVAKARAERVLGRPENTVMLVDSDTAALNTMAALERGAALLDLRRSAEALEVFDGISVERGSREWVTLSKLEASALLRAASPHEADLVLDRAQKQAAELANREAIQALAIHRAELRIELGSKGLDVQTLLRGIPSQPPCARRHYLDGRLEESKGNRQKAIDGYRRALRIDAGHIESLERLVALTESPGYRRRLQVLLLDQPTEHSLDPEEETR